MNHQKNTQLLRCVPLNPIHYFNRNMTSEEYDKLMSRMRETNFEKL